MSSCLSSRACGFNLDQMIKWSCTNSSITTSNSSSPSSTLSESSNSTITISTRKPRTQRKRPNQTYNEAAALLSMACPNIFTTKHLTKIPNKFTKHQTNFFNEPPELIYPFPVTENSGFLLRRRIMETPCSLIESKVQKTGEIEPNCFLDYFDTDSILDEEIEQGIDSIMGDSNSIPENNDFNNCYGYPMGLGFGVKNRVRALRNGGDERNWWSVPMVDISPAAKVKCEKNSVGKKKKKRVEELMTSELELRQGDFNSGGIGGRIVLKLDYDAVLNAWSDKRLPFPEEISRNASVGGDIHTRAATIDLFTGNGGWIESSATHSIEKNHLKKIRHQIRNSCSDRRPRCKGRFVKKPNSLPWDEET